MTYVMEANAIDRTAANLPLFLFDAAPCNVCGDDYGVHDRLVFDNPPGSGSGWKVLNCDRAGEPK